MPVPLTGAASLRAGQSAEPALWQPAFLRALEHEAADGFDLLNAMDRAWRDARLAVSGRRRDAHNARAVDVLTAALVLSATTLTAPRDRGQERDRPIGLWSPTAR